ncbi:type II secretion system secretin lipoprotein PulQ [Desulfuromonas soudanensis]|uniref:Type II secretion system secretin lipoprotein PulQ n=1 Tax=Desulfuromonas soudanensis TaxID=1603606 RepID=A0A0M5IZB3_9BACT|nr:cohesin domain-containing protein [Desulfuromonas soudanensis]ALC17168.1 type II secretion system secretin lipoprotein PulQ [Desulfuromonas soudanensis]
MNVLWIKKFVTVLVLLSLVSGCASGHGSFKRGQDYADKGMYDEAVAALALAVTENPESHEYRMKLQTARAKAAQKHLQTGRRAGDQGDYRAAAQNFSQAAALDPTLEVARQMLAQAQELVRSEELTNDAETLYRGRRLSQARTTLEEAIQLNPANTRARELLEKTRQEKLTTIDGFELDVASDKPITLKFKDAKIRDVFNIVSKLSGINFIFDEDIKPQSVTVLLENASFAQALELLLRMNNLGKKVLNAKTIIIYPRTKEKDKQYEDQIIQIFYLSNIDAKKAVNLLRTMLQLRKVYVHEELNALVIRDSPDVIKLAQQVIESADRADSEVVFDLELVEISHTDNLNIGARLDTYQVKGGFGEPGISPPAFVGLTQHFKPLDFLYTIPNATFDFQKSLSDAEILANPKIRLKNGAKAKVHVGSREPIVTTTNNANGDVTSTNIQYVDVGVKLDLEAKVQLDGTVLTKVNLEVSNKGATVGTEQNIAFAISTTNAMTELVLKDGEQTIIGGLIRDDVSNSKTTFPILGRIPLLGPLLSGYKKDKTKREILLSITPHIVKNVDIPGASAGTIWSGGEDDLRAGKNFGSFATAFKAATEPVPLEVAPARVELGDTPAFPPEPENLFPLPAAEEAPVPTPPVPEEVLPLEPVLPVPPESGVAPQGMPPELPPSADAGSALPGEAAVAPVIVPQEETATEPVENVTLPPLDLPPVAADSRVFVTGPNLVNAGETFTVEVAVDEVQNLYSAPLFVTYPPQLLDFVAGEEGTFLRQGEASTIFTSSPNRERGQLIVGYKQGLGGAGASGGGALFRLTFKAKAPGMAEIALDRINFRDPAGNRLSVVPAGLQVEVR